MKIYGDIFEKLEATRHWSGRRMDHEQRGKPLSDEDRKEITNAFNLSKDTLQQIIVRNSWIVSNNIYQRVKLVNSEIFADGADGVRLFHNAVPATERAMLDLQKLVRQDLELDD